MSELLKGSLGFKGNKGDTGEIGTPVPYNGTFEQLKSSNENKFYNYIILDSSDTDYEGHWVYYDRKSSEWKDGGLYLSHQLTNEIKDRLENTENKVNENKTKQDLLEQKYEEQIKNMTLENPSNAEIVDARKGFDTLNKRLDNSDAVKANKSEVDETKTSLQNQINSLASGSPLVASSIDEMTDTTRVYVNTNNGHWYTYNGSTWVDGGVYQSTKIADEEVSYPNLDSNLKEIVNENLLNIYSTLQKITGSYINTSGNLINDTSNSVELLKIPVGTVLELNCSKFYEVNNTNNFSIYGGYIKNEICTEYKVFKNTTSVTNEVQKNNPSLINQYASDDLVYFIIQDSTSDYFGLNLKLSNYDLTDCIKVYSLKTFFNETNLQKIAGISEIYAAYKEKNLARDDLEIKGYINTTNGYIGTNLAHYNIANIHKLTNDIYMYTKLISGTQSMPVVYTYDKNFNPIRKIENFSDVVIDNESYQCAFIEKEESEEYVAFTRKYCEYGTDTVVYEYEYFISEELTKTLAITKINGREIASKEKVAFKKWYAIGDSITNKNFRCLINYLDYCQEDLDIEVVNLGASGTGYKRTENTFITRLNLIDSYNIETDIITVMGSINDITYVNTELGVLGDTTTDTLYGSIYQFFNTLFNKFNGVRVGLITPICSSTSQGDSKWEAYRKALVDTAKLFNVPCLDITDICNLRPWEESFRNEFFEADGIGNSSQVDGTHPNSRGHKLFYSRIKEFVKTL